MIRWRRALLVLVAGCASLVGCADAPAPEWIRLARDVTWMQTSPAAAFEVGEGADARTFRVVDADGASWLETTVQRDDWKFRKRLMGGAWAVPIGVYSSGAPLNDGDGPRRRKEGLVAGDRRFRYARPPTTSPTEWRFGAGSFSTLDGRLMLKLEEGEDPPDEAVLSVHAPRAGTFGGTRGLAADRFSGEGLSVWSGESYETELELPAQSALHFATAVEPALYGRSAQPGSVRFVVELDGETIFDHTIDDATTEAYAWHEVELPNSGGSARLTLRVEGSFAYTSFLAPSIGPANVGTYGDRPWGTGRADVVVFLADTFRADSLAAYGGTLDITPNLNAFATDSLVYERAWSTGTFTLPAHASMFAGLFPRQVGIASTANRLPDELTTIAELLADRGYRTGAITDSVMVSARLGLAQGFSWFDEMQESLDSTLARTRDFLDADDGRPIFLFVHTYRTHLPYRVSDQTRRELGERLGIEGDFQTLRAQLTAQLSNPATDPSTLQQTSDALRAHYLGGVADLDRGFATFLDDLDARGLRDSGYLVFTSDHGEGFGEHAVFYHTGPVWEELGRVPLILSGPGIEAGVRPFGASLVDLAPTLAAMAGVSPHERWLGSSWLTLDEDRPIYLFECQDQPGSTLAVVDGPRKVIGFEDATSIERGELLGAFDLDEDPGEHRSVHADAAWPRKLYTRVGPAAAQLLEPVVGTEAAGLDPEKEAELRAMGYGGD